MKRISLLHLSLLAFLCAIMAACGSDNKKSTSGPSSDQPVKAVLTLSTAVNGALPADTIITGYDLMLGLPDGVTVKSSSPPETDPDVVVASNMAAGLSITGVYSASTGDTSGKLRILVASANGLSAGAFSTVTCDIAAGASPAVSDFELPLSFSAVGYNTKTDTTVSLDGYLTLTADVHIE